MDDEQFQKKFLPTGYRYCGLKVDFHSESEFEANFNVSIRNLTDADGWVRHFEATTKSNWKVRATYPLRSTIQRKDYICHHHDFRHSEKKGKKCEARVKFTGCTAKLIVKIKAVNKRTEYRYPWVKDGMPATVSLSYRHNHPLINAQVLSFRKVDPIIKEKFLEYFNKGLSVASAIEYHVNEIDLDPEIDDPILTRADAALNPSRRVVSHLYDVWREENLGSRIGEGMWTMLREKIQQYSSVGASVSVDEETGVIVIVTPLMFRAHVQHASKTIAFVDSTASCDADNHSITFLMLVSSYGAVPGGVVITTGQREVDYVAGFSILKSALGSSAFGGSGWPQIFMTDDSTAERNALHTVWPSATLMLCHFHILQAVWRWLWDSRHEVKKEDRQKFMKLFKDVLHATDRDIAEQFYQKLLCNVEHSGYQEYVRQLWTRRTEWCKAWRNIPSMRGHHTNNFSEITVRLFKDHVLTRCKAYNAVALVDFVVTVMDRFYRNRLEKFANGRITASNILLEKLLLKSSYIKDPETIGVVQSDGVSIYIVPSQNNDNIKYTVDPSIGCCSCAVGMDGSCCKHQVAVFRFFSETFPNLPPITAASRHECAVLALGPNAPPLAFYSNMSERRVDEVDGFAGHLSRTESSNVTPEILAGSSKTGHEVSVSGVCFAWKQLSGKVETLLSQQEGDCSEFMRGIEKMQQRLDKVRTANQLSSFFHSSAFSLPRRHHSHAMIRTQPTSAARRKQAQITHGAKRQLAGRPPAGEKRAKKRPRSLSANITNNLPNAKSHGIGH